MAAVAGPLTSATASAGLMSPRETWELLMFTLGVLALLGAAAAEIAVRFRSVGVREALEARADAAPEPATAPPGVGEWLFWYGSALLALYAAGWLLRAGV